MNSASNDLLFISVPFCAMFNSNSTGLLMLYYIVHRIYCHRLERGSAARCNWAAWICEYNDMFT